jgi:phage-related protein
VKESSKELVWLHGEVKTPPFSASARRTTGFLLRLVQDGVLLSMPHSRPMPHIGPRCHELRINDADRKTTWRLIYRVDGDAVIIADVFAKKVQKTPKNIITSSQRRLRMYDNAAS